MDLSSSEAMVQAPEQGQPSRSEMVMDGAISMAYRTTYMSIIKNASKTPTEAPAEDHTDHVRRATEGFPLFANLPIELRTRI